MFNKSIAYRLSIYISLAVIGVFMAFILFAFFFNSGILKNNIENQAKVLGSQVLMIAEKQLVSTREITSNISDQALYYVQHNDVELFISKLMARYPNLNAIHINIDTIIPNVAYHNYFAFRAKDSIHFERENESIYHCEHEKRIFEKEISIGIPGWTESFKCKINNKEVVSYYCPIRIKKNDGELISIGSVITELSLLELNDSIKNLKIGDNGQIAFAAIVSSNGTYLTHPDKDYILNEDLYALPGKVSKMDSVDIYNILNSGNPGTTIAYPDYLDYQKCWVYYTPMKETGWTLFFVMLYDDLFVPLYLLVLRMLFFSVLGILIIFFIVTYISNKLIQPLSSVTTQLKKFSNISGEFDLTTRNEVELVSGSLDYLKSWYEKFKLEQYQEEKLSTQRKLDLIEASEIQMSLINTDFSAFAERNDIDLFATYKPARIVSGDLFDFIFLDSDNLFFTIGDVSGKGISAAFFMSVAQTLLKSNSRLKTPGKIITNANNELYTVNHHQFFLTLFCGVLNLKTGILNYCNAAHTTTLITNNNGEIFELEKSHGMPLGLYSDKVYEESSLILNPDDSIILYSDGVTELQNSENKHFGKERLCQILQHANKLKPKLLIAEIENNLELFKGKMSQTDDITIMVIQFKNKKKA